ncbi:MAG: pyridinium-3,5-bisthiocarboxylic acid mononucleotide nickel chelatase [Actinomycetota bacterium]|jgi:uncharacterized protein (TIGR00299 family) protein
MSPTVAWFHCFAGIAGDMALGALIDAGADVDEVRGLVGRLPVRGWSLHTEDVLRGGIAATQLVVDAEETSVVRTYAHIVGLIEEARLPARVRDRSLSIFGAIAAAEGRIHRRPIEQVHFHEVGAIDSIVDIVGVCAALEVLDVDAVCASTIATGTGMIRAAHGMLPNPSPAVVELLAAAEAPTRGLELAVELTTPTGAGILAALATSFGPLPPMTLRSTGFGAGTRDLDHLPNSTQVVIGTSMTQPATQGQPVVLLEANVDDATGETLAHTITTLLEAGAHDAWVTPIVMKKGRPAHTVHVLVDPVESGRLADVLARETGTLGVRGAELQRWPSSREIDEVTVEGDTVRVKVSPNRVKVEHDDAARVAKRTGIPLREVVSLAEEAWRRRRPSPEPDPPEPA